jgi:hypothetical protein
MKRDGTEHDAAPEMAEEVETPGCIPKSLEKQVQLNG